MPVTIQRLGHLGDGIAEGPVYASRVLPGEVIDGAIDGARIARPKIVTPSQHRVSAPCSHYKSCGGCALQHASDSFVADWKADVVRQALGAQGLDAPIRNVITSVPNSRRRATFSGRRMKSGPLVGFHAPGSDAVTDVPDCQLLAPELMPAIAACRDFVQMLGSRKGEMKFQVTSTDVGLDVNLTGGRKIDGADFGPLAAIAQTHRLARLSIDGDVIVIENPPRLSFDGIPVSPPPGAFLQATSSGETALRNGVFEAVEHARRVVDLFAGCGTFAVPMARVSDVHGVEGDALLTAAMDDAWRKADGLKELTTEVRDLYRRPLLPDEIERFDAVVIDPPRAGAEAQTRAIADAKPPKIAFVSCNPTTFARDAKILIDAGYTLDWIDVVDQFRWATHIELVTQFSA